MAGESDMKPRVTVLVSSPSNHALDIRAHSLFDRLADRFESTIVCHVGGPTRRITTFVRALRATRPDCIYVMDPIYAAVAATCFYRTIRRVHVVVDTGDLVRDLAQEMGHLGRAGLMIVGNAEQAALKMANAIVVRGGTYRDLLLERGYSSVETIPDGVDCKQFYPMDVSDWRARFGFSADDLVIGTVGTLNWNLRRKTCYGWEMVEALAWLRDLPAKGWVIGDGDGKAKLQARAQELGVEHRIIFTGQMPYAQLPQSINAMDIALLTQSVSPIANVRTTGKLPLYLACDRYIIASRVGEAARVLESEMLLDYHGMSRDENYPIKLAGKIRLLVSQREQLQLNGRHAALARQRFDYAILARQLANTLDRALEGAT